MKLYSLSMALFFIIATSAQAIAAPKCNCETGEGLVFPACREKCAGLSLQENAPEILKSMEGIEKADSGESQPDSQYKENPSDTDTTST